MVSKKLTQLKDHKILNKTLNSVHFLQNGWFPKIMVHYPQIIHFNRVFHYFHHPFWGPPIFGNTQIIPQRFEGSPAVTLSFYKYQQYFQINRINVESGWWFQPIWKILVKMGIFPNFRGENKQYLKPPPSECIENNMKCSLVSSNT